MPDLTYRYLGDSVQVGQPLGCDSSGWPYRVEGVLHDDEAVDATVVTLEPWPIPGPGASEQEKVEYAAAMQHARERAAGEVVDR